MIDELWRMGLFAHPPSVTDASELTLGRWHRADWYDRRDAGGYGFTVTVVK